MAEIKVLWQYPTVRAFWVIVGLQSLATGWFFGTYVLFLLSNGLTLLQANLLNTAYMLTDSIFNPYTGKLADKYGQKRIYLWGQILWFLGMFQYGIGGVFWRFLAAEMTAAVGSALMSDALESWVENTTDHEIGGRAISVSSSFGSLTVIPAAVLGGIVGSQWGLQWPWLLAAANGLLVAIVCRKILAPLPEVYGGQEAEVVSVTQVVKTSFEVAPLRMAMMITFGIAAGTTVFNMFWQPILKSVSGTDWWLGFLWIGIATMSSIGAYWAKSQANGLGMVKMILWIAVPISLTPLFHSTLPLVAAFLLHELGRGAYRPIMWKYSNRHIESHYRSTANSIQSTARTLGAASGLLISGVLSTFFAPVIVWEIAAVWLLFLAAWAFKKSRG